MLSRCARLVVFLVLLAWGPSPAPAQGADPAAERAAREQRLLAGARNEGELVLYSSMQVASVAPLQRAFEEKYGVTLRTWRGSGKDILARATAEARADRFAYDVAETDGFVLEAMAREGLLAELDSPYLGDLIPQAVPKHRQWIATRVSIFTAVYNTNLVKKEKLPKTYPDLLDPAFKGALGIEADDYDWFGMLIARLGERKGLSLFRDIVARNGISVRRGHTLLTNLTAAGEVPIGLTVFVQNAEVARKAGAPVDWFLIEPAIARPNAVAVAKRAPHPNAAMLFADFMLSDGQEVLRRREFTPTSKKVPSLFDRVAVDLVAPDRVLDEGQKWQRLYDEIVLSPRRP
jgi:iron(III) transport system substrate-binding protein